MQNAGFYYRLQVLACIIASCCASTSFGKDKLLALPPAPMAITSGQVDFSATTPESIKNNRVSIFYATRRLPTDDKAGYSKKFDNHLRVGEASLHIGPKDLGWETLHSAASLAEREQQYDIHLNKVEQIADMAPDDPLSKLSPDMQTYVDLIDAELEQSSVKDITIIVHGAFNSFYYAAAEAAQYRFYTGKLAVLIAYSWPAVENHLAYKANARHAEQSEAGLVKLVRILGEHSSAENINILGYSVGGRLAGGAMAKLADEMEGENLAKLNGDLHLGHLYLTSSDEPIEEFRNYAPKFVNMFDVVTVTIDYNDPILGEAQMTGGGKRLGRPAEPTHEKAKDSGTEAQKQGIRDAVNSGRLHILNLGIADIPGYEFYHGSWYLNPWVSSDVLVSMNMGLPPSKRGLTTYEKQDLTYWYFPKNYISTLRQALLIHKAERERQEAKQSE
jgi:hypothetical protein